MGALLVVVVLALAVIITLSRTAVVVPQQHAVIVERLGRYDRTLLGGLHTLIPFIDSRHHALDLRESVKPIPDQDCITRDNVRIRISAIIFYKITYNNTYCHVFKFNNGKICQVTEYLDTELVSSVFGK
jgi:regulator of protease activity HflC (stomatin/prohibitin superfamily)